MKKITCLVFLSAFMLLRPFNFSFTGQMYPGDDWSYFAHASVLAFGAFPSYEKEFWTVGTGVPDHPPGPGIMAAPFVFVLSQLDRWGGSNIFIHRTEANIHGSWTQFGFSFASVFYFWIACLLLFLSARMFTGQRSGEWAVISMVLAQGAPLFVFRRPVFSHVYELVLLSFLVWLLCRVVKEGRGLSMGNMIATGIACGLVVLTRYNNVFFAMGFPVLLVFAAFPKKRLIYKILTFGSMGLLMIGMVVIFKLWPESLISRPSLYAVDNLMKATPLGVYFQRIWHIVVGCDWGLIFTAPFLLVAWIWQYFSGQKDLQPFKWLSVLLFVNLWVVMQWMTQGGWYGYRYLLFSAIPILTVPWAVFLEVNVFKKGIWIKILFGLAAVQPVLSMLFFEGNSRGLTLSPVMQYFGISGWGNNDYQGEIWKLIFSSPLEALLAFLKGGGVYCLSLVGHFFSLDWTIFLITRGVYPVFDPVLLVKTWILYGLPFVLYFSWRRFCRGSFCGSRA